MAKDLPINARITIPAGELEFTFVRSAGPGGQNVNKVNSKAVLRWAVARTPSLPEEVRARFLAANKHRITVDGDLLVTCQRYRDQGRNIDECLEKLRTMIAAVLTPPRKRRPTKPTKGARERRLKAKKEQSGKKQDRRWDA